MVLLYIVNKDYGILDPTPCSFPRQLASTYLRYLSTWLVLHGHASSGTKTLGFPMKLWNHHHIPQVHF
jgi:hypothetical protein